MVQDISYPDDYVDRLELIWGVGFLSPGGPEEVKEVLWGIDTSGKTLLDIGCGIAGPAMLIGREFDVHRVVGIDIEAHLVERARRNVAAAGLEERVDVKRVEPGPLPFDEARFDIVFSKDSLIHVDDKAAVYREIFRVLRPGGIYAASDWLASENAWELPDFANYVEGTPFKFIMRTAAQTEDIMREAGLVDVSLRDRNAWYTDFARKNVALMAGPLRERFRDVCDDDTYDRMLDNRRANAEAAACGGLRPTHLRGSKPAT